MGQRERYASPLSEGDPVDSSRDMILSNRCVKTSHEQRPCLGARYEKSRDQQSRASELIRQVGENVMNKMAKESKMTR